MPKEKPIIHQVFLVAEMENGDIRQFHLSSEQRFALNVFITNASKQKEFVLLNEEHNLILKSKCKKLK